MEESTDRRCGNLALAVLHELRVSVFLGKLAMEDGRSNKALFFASCT